MSRIGKQPITIPAGVTVTIDGSSVTTKGPKGDLTLSDILPAVSIRQEENQLLVEDAVESNKGGSAYRGLYRSLLANNVQGVSTGFTRILDFIGVGYRCSVEGNQLKLEVGYSMPKYLTLPPGVKASVEKNTILTIEGPDKQVLGQFAAHIRAFRPPEPYKGKGIKYREETIRRKAGKAGGKGK